MDVEERSNASVHRMAQTAQSESSRVNQRPFQDCLILRHGSLLFASVCTASHRLSATSGSRGGQGREEEVRDVANATYTAYSSAEFRYNCFERFGEDTMRYAYETQFGLKKVGGMRT